MRSKDVHAPMQLVKRTPTAADQALSPRIDAALVDSMCQNSWPMLFGAICAAAAALMTALKTGYAPIWPCALLIMTIGIARAIQMRKYEKRTTVLTPEQAADFEPRYMVGAMLYAGVLGLWCAVVLLGTDDPIAHMLCTTVTIAYTGGGAARNYGRPRIVQLHILLSCGPMSLALAVHGDPYHIGLAGLLVLFFLGLKDINLSLHSIFVKALEASEREAAIAAQFDTALNNMPHGLCMFDANGRLAVMNYRFSNMMRVGSDLVSRSVTVEDVVDACVEARAITAPAADAIVSQIKKSRAGEVTTLDRSGASERALSWTFQPMAGGGMVVLVEDITERRNAEAKISHMARFDELTGLPNRVSFRDEIEQLLANSNADAPISALLFVDLDQFKQVNDTLGHPSGDKLLCAVTARLRGLLRLMISLRASVAMNSSFSSAGSNPPKMRRRWPAGSSIASANGMRSITI